MIETIKNIAQHIVLFFVKIFTFITEIPLPPPIDLNEIHIVRDTDRIVFGLVVFLHLLYIFLLNHCLEWDKIDNFMHKKAIQINDVPFGVYKYLIRIYTNWRPRSGTRSKIFIQLHGNLSQNTICYFLHNPFLPHRKLFVWGDCSFFLINTANPVGDIQAITVGHDDSVDSSWFLSKVLVKDLQMNKEYRFFAHCWLLNDKRNLAELNSYVTLKPVDPSYVEPFGERVFQWVRRCYRERPLMSFFYLNLLTPQSRVTRLNITYFYIILSMLVNMMYFNKKKVDLNYVLWTSSIKSISSYLILLILQNVFDIEVFTTFHPTKRQFNIRIVVYIIFFIIYVAQIITLLIYSTLYKNNRGNTVAWLLLFIINLIQSEFFYALIAAFSKATLYTFFSKDPFTEEGEKIIMTYRNKLFNQKWFDKGSNNFE